MRKHRHTVKGLAHRLIRPAVALVAFVLTFAVVSSAVHARARYFYCEAMGLLDVDPCLRAANHAVEGASSRALAEVRPADCCAVVTLPGMPEATAIAPPAVPPAAQAVALSAPVHAGACVSALSLPPSRRQPWRRPPRLASAARARSTVSLT